MSAGGVRRRALAAGVLLGALGAAPPAGAGPDPGAPAPGRQGTGAAEVGGPAVAWRPAPPRLVAPGERVGDQLVLGRDLVVGGDVEGSAVTVGGDIRVRPGARIAGDAVALGGRVEVADGGRIAGDRVALPLPSLRPRPVRPGAGAALLLVAGTGLLLGAALPDRVDRIGDEALGHPLRSLATGCLALPLALVAVAVLLGSCVGLLPGLCLLAALLAAVVLGLAGMGEGLACHAPWPHGPTARVVAHLLVASTLVLAALRPLPWAVAPFLLGAWGLGAALRTRLGGRRILP